MNLHSRTNNVPVVLIREVDKAGRNTLALENSEGGKTLGDGETVILVAVDDQGGRLPVLDMVGRVPALVVLTSLGVPWDTVVLKRKSYQKRSLAKNIQRNKPIKITRNKR